MSLLLLRVDGVVHLGHVRSVFVEVHNPLKGLLGNSPELGLLRLKVLVPFLHQRPLGDIKLDALQADRARDQTEVAHCHMITSGVLGLLIGQVLFKGGQSDLYALQTLRIPGIVKEHGRHLR